MPVVLIVLGILIVVLVLGAGGSSPERKKRANRLALGVLFVVVIALLVRAGQPWLVAAGTVLLGGLRFVAPLLVRLAAHLLPRLLGQKAQNSTPSEGSRQGFPSATEMTRQEALEVLGVTEGASDEEVRKAYAELIKRVHPDRGGSAYLAARVNGARDFLLPKERR